MPNVSSENCGKFNTKNTAPTATTKIVPMSRPRIFQSIPDKTSITPAIKKYTSEVPKSGCNCVKRNGITVTTMILPSKIKSVFTVTFLTFSLCLLIKADKYIIKPIFVNSLGCKVKPGKWNQDLEPLTTRAIDSGLSHRTINRNTVTP